MYETLMHTLRGMLLLLCVLGSALFAEEGEDDLKKKVDSLMRLLGAEEYNERERAGKELLTIGRRALPALQKIKSDPDPEVRLRVNELIKQIEAKEPEDSQPEKPEKREKPKRMRVEVHAICVECQAETTKFTDELPAKCPKCKKMTVYTMYRCTGEGKECGNRFAYIPPNPPKMPSPDNMAKLSEEEQKKLMAEMDATMMKHERLQMEAMRCPKCKSYNTGPMYTEAQKEKFEELRKKYSRKTK